MKKNAISFQDKLRVAYECGQRKTYREIEEKLDISKSSVGRIIKMMKDDNQYLAPKYDFVNPLRFHYVAYQLFSSPLISNRAIATLSQNFDFRMSKSSIGRISQSLGFKSFYQQPKEKLNQTQKDYRVEFATKIRASFLYLLPWVFSDESMICLEPYKKKVRFIRSYDCDELYVEKQGYPIKVMVWACIGKNFKSNLVRIEGKLNAISYQNMLANNQIIEKLNERYGPKGFVFQEDGASPH